MRQTLLFGTLVLLAACGNPGDRPWDENNDGLIAACEGLNPIACDATPGCEREPVYCTLECRDDGHGGCLPCPQSEICRPVPPPPPGDCSQLPTSLCSFVPQCELVEEQVCNGGGATPSGADFAAPEPPRCGNECHTVQRCQNRQPVTCEQLSPDQCLSKPGCAIVHDVAAGFAPCAPGTTDCRRPEVDPLPRCITLPTPVTCEQLSPDQCLSKPGCAIVHDVVEGFAPCAPGTDCRRPEVDPLPRCITIPVPSACEQRDVNSCTLDGQCMLERTALCDVSCEPGGQCPPCGVDAVQCVPLPQPTACEHRDLGSCELDGQCRIEAWACPAVCELMSDGGCRPCEAPPTACVPVAPQPPPPSRCAGLDEQSCIAAGCELVSAPIACTTVCDPLSDGGCRPCAPYACIDP